MATPTASAPAPPKLGLFAQLGRLPRAFWMVNVMEMLERLAYYGVRVVMPIYIAQADEINGLHFTQMEKGTIAYLARNGYTPDEFAAAMQAEGARLAEHIQRVAPTLANK